jgi:protein gp37
MLTKRPNLINPSFEFPSNVWLGVSVEDKQHGLPRIDVLRSFDIGIRFLSIEPLLEDLGRIDLTGISWVIVGGESGPHARTMKPEWVDNILGQCIDANVSFFFKQWGGVNKKSAGRLLGGREYNEFPVPF